jgi:hypothetical protein
VRPQGSPAKSSGWNFHLILKASAWPVAGRGTARSGARTGPQAGHEAALQDCKTALKMYRKFSRTLVRMRQERGLDT